MTIKNFANEKVWRIIPSRYPPIHLFERIAPKEEWDILIDIESLTNDRLRCAAGLISVVPQEDRVFGPGAGYIMAPFVYLNHDGSRFSNGTYGVYYAADSLNCAISETKYHRENFLKQTATPPIDLEMRSLTAILNGELFDISGKQPEYQNVYDPICYTASQKLAKNLKDERSDGIYYSSVRFPQGNCYAIFKPKLLSKCQQERHLIYRWNGKQIEHVLDIKERKM